MRDLVRLGVVQSEHAQQCRCRRLRLRVDLHAGRHGGEDSAANRDQANRRNCASRLRRGPRGSFSSRAVAAGVADAAAVACRRSLPRTGRWSAPSPICRARPHRPSRCAARQARYRPSTRRKSTWSPLSSAWTLDTGS